MSSGGRVGAGRRKDGGWRGAPEGLGAGLPGADDVLVAQAAAELAGHGAGLHTVSGASWSWSTGTVATWRGDDPQGGALA